MFYDTMMQLADKKNFVQFNKDKLHKEKLKGHSSTYFEANRIDELKIIMD